MNEVTRIHLGRVPFTIAVEAHKSLRDYLASIEKEVHDPEVINEIELRMSELLMERGITADKVILPEDVLYLKEQLGNPGDFSDDEDAQSEDQAKTDDKTPRRLFRNPDDAIVAGVAAGLSSYSGLDATLIRLLFILLAIFGGGLGIVLYLVLWLVMPPAETVSEKLQMQGKPVTLGALKESVNKADLNGAAKRVNNRVLPIINTLFRIAAKLVGVGLIVSGLGIICAVSVTKIYMLLHDDRLFQENLFPVGAREHWLLAIGMGLAVIGAAFLMLAGIATFKHKWPVRGWITGVLLALFVAGSVAGAALTVDTIPRVRERYHTSLHTTAIKNIQAFNKVQTSGSVDIFYSTSPTYAVSVHYFGNPDLSKLKVTVTDGTLRIDSTGLDAEKHCTMLCLFPRYDLIVQIYAPNVEQFNTPPRTEIFYPSAPVTPAL